ncbi:MAG: tRNA 2-thiouridine(34) synthase MnmA, partial [Planctomicrobium sp.]|nr:tRNA 2-thiouridine(34) synthase MnmA [Planctomicrobium sp.]
VAFGDPRFVVRIEPESRQVVIGTKEELGRQTVEADRVNWLKPDLQFPLKATAQIRYQHTPGVCTVHQLEEDRIQVEFEDPQFGVAPGQALVLYDEDRVLGGGWIL